MVCLLRIDKPLISKHHERMHTGLAIINGQLHAGKQLHTFTARGFAQCLKLTGIEFIVIGDHADAHFSRFQGTDVVANISVGLSGIAKFFICTGKDEGVLPFAVYPPWQKGSGQ